MKHKYQFQKLRAQNTRAPCHRRQQNRALSPGQAGWFLWDCLGASSGEGSSAELQVGTQSSCPIFHSSTPVAHGGVSSYFSEQILKCLVFRVEMFISYRKCCFAAYRKAQRNTYSMYPEWKEWVERTKIRSGTSYASQSPFLPTCTHLKKIPNPSLLWNVHFTHRKKLNIFYFCVYAQIHMYRYKISKPPKHISSNIYSVYEIKSVARINIFKFYLIFY